MKPQCRKDPARLAQFDADLKELMSNRNKYRGIRTKQENDACEFWHRGRYRGAAKTLALIVELKAKCMADEKRGIS